MFHIKTILILGILFIFQGCAILANLNPDYKRYGPKIEQAFEECYNSKIGGDINSFLYPKKKYSRYSNIKTQEVYKNYFENEKYKDTNETYKDIRLSCQKKYEKEQDRLAKEKEKREKEKKEKRQKAFNDNVALAKKSGYKGYIQYRDMHDLIIDAERGNININKYKDYVIEFNDNGTYAYKFTQEVNGLEIYQPNYRYGVNLTIGIKREKEQKNQVLEGQPLQNIQLVSFKGVDHYKTILGVKKQILIFDRAINYKVAIIENALSKISKK